LLWRGCALSSCLKGCHVRVPVDPPDGQRFA
jgi:hypothetical protein